MNKAEKILWNIIAHSISNAQDLGITERNEIIQYVSNDIGVKEKEIKDCLLDTTFLALDDIRKENWIKLSKGVITREIEYKPKKRSKAIVEMNIVKEGKEIYRED